MITVYCDYGTGYRLKLSQSQSSGYLLPQRGNFLFSIEKFGRLLVSKKMKLSYFSLAFVITELAVSITARMGVRSQHNKDFHE